jgi:RNA recognition motif-containing protein
MKSMRLYVGNLSKEVTDLELKKLAGPFGVLASSAVVRDDDGHSKGFAYLDYKTAEAARAAMAALNGKEVCGRALEVKESINQLPQDVIGGRF